MPLPPAPCSALAHSSCIACRTLASSTALACCHRPADPFSQLFGALAGGGPAVAGGGSSFMISSSSYSSMGPGGLTYQASSTTRVGPGGVGGGRAGPVRGEWGEGRGPGVRRRR